MVCWTSIFFLLWPVLAMAQVVAVPNPSFEQGTTTPEGWTLSAGQGEWVQGQAAEGERALAVTGDGQGTHYWRSAPLSLTPSAVYRLRFWACSLGMTQGTAITGPIFCNRDLGRLPEKWTEYHSFFVAPAILTPEEAWIRFGQWHADGTLFFDQVELVQAQPVYAEDRGVVLGEGERLQGKEYTFVAPFSSASRSHSRPLAAHQCRFNTDRWVFGKDSFVLYRHQIAGRRQLQAEVEVSVGYYQSGILAVEVSADGQKWREVGTLAGQGSSTFSVPAELLPAPEIWVRLAARTRQALGTESDPGSFQVNAYAYRATLEGDPLDLRGATRFVAITRTDPRLQVQVLGLGEGIPGGRNEVLLELENRTAKSLIARPLVILTRNGVQTSFPAGEVEIAPGPASLSLPYELPGAGAWELRIFLEGEVQFQGVVDLYLEILYETAYGQRLPGSSAEVGLWWASSGWKISRNRPIPREEGKAMVIRAARGEAEAAQLALRPAQDLRGLTVRAGALTGPAGALIPASQVEILQVQYVPISQPTDPIGVADLWPDPLLPLRAPLDLPAGFNQPLWVRVQVPENAVPGAYQGKIYLQAQGYAAEVPLQVEVFDFALPRRATCTTAFGFSFENVVRYQRLSTEEEQRQVLALYLKNFSAHHISPYNPAPLDPFRVKWEGLEPHFDWTAYDVAMTRAIDTLGFNSFSLPIPGLGGGSFYDRREPELLGYGEGDPEYWQAFRAYLKAVEEHLASRGWLDEAYVYWFDEPEPSDYEFVMNGFRKLREAAPRLNRMLTEQVEPELIGGPNIWCPVSYAYDPERSASRREAGDTFWWYICTAPKAPYAGLFIDHPGTELRVWLWQTWQRGIQGILVWQTNYWTSGAAYPDRLQNPYCDPMSWVSWYGAPPGSRQPWGNGDGRFIYPPLAAAEGTSEGSVLEGPVESIRWEMLRDGIEDYEYFAILRDLLAARDDLEEPEWMALAHLLEVPAAVSASMTEFTVDPAPLEAHRLSLARAIERLRTR